MRTVSTTLAMLLFAASGALAQFDDFGGFGDFGLDAEGDPVLFSAEFTPATDTRAAVLTVTAEIEPGYHIYSLTQPKGGPLRTTIKLSPSDKYRVIGPWQSFPKPHSRIDHKTWGGLTIEEHENKVTFFLPIAIEAGVDVGSLEIKGAIDLQACKEACIPVEAEFNATLGKGVEVGEIKVDQTLATPPLTEREASDTQPKPPTEAGMYRAEDSEVTWFGWLTTGEAGEATLSLQAQPTGNWHINAYATMDSAKGVKPTLIGIEPSAAFTVGEPTAIGKVIERDASDIGFGTIRYYEGTVTWKVPLTISPGGAVNTSVVGMLGYQACEGTDGPCEFIKGVKFNAPVDFQSAGGSISTVEFAAANYADAAALAASLAAKPIAPPATPPDAKPAAQQGGYDLTKIAPIRAIDYLNETKSVDRGLIGNLWLAFFGGLVLNVMPCVLPVIGLKVMSFVHQAEHHRAQAFGLSVWYALGMMSVFWVLAALAIVVGLSWGQQFQSVTFNVSMIAIVFAMALSLTGVWEIPIPGFAGTSQASELASREGPAGSFLKGIITTLLATPCTGPGMGVALTWALGQTPTNVMLVFTSLGLGMASPYLLLGMFPELLKFMPKPGAWMDTFKQVMGFILLGTVVFLLTSIEQTYVVPVVAMLVGIGIACWLVGRSQHNHGGIATAGAWTGALATTVLATMFSIGWLHPEVMKPRAERRIELAASEMAGDTIANFINELEQVDTPEQLAATLQRLQSSSSAVGNGPWRAFSTDAVGQLARQGGQSVFVDFSADWCAICKTLEATVLHTEAVEEVIASTNVATMYGDFTNKSPEIVAALRAFRSSGVPLLVLIPKDDPYRPIYFPPDDYTEEVVVNVLRKAAGLTYKSDEPAAEVASLPQ